MGRRLARVIDLVDFTARLKFNNHHPCFSKLVTTLVDALPIKVGGSGSSVADYLLFQPKYKDRVVKVTIAVSFLREIVFYAGLNWGIEMDGTILQGYIAALARPPWELWIGDGVYNVVPQMIVPPRRIRIPQSRNYFQLTKRQVIMKDILGEIRSPVEHVNAYFEHHAMFEGRSYRGDLETLEMFVDVTVHATALYIRMGYGKLPGYGDWPHYP